jgi:hypothetical protein
VHSDCHGRHAEAPPGSALFTKSPPLSEGFGLCTNYPKNQKIEPAGYTVRESQRDLFYFLKINFISHCGEVYKGSLFIQKNE